MISSIVLIAMQLLSSTSPDLVGPTPKAIQQMLSSRDGLGSGRLEWTRTSVVTGAPVRQHFRSRFALNGDAVFENRGDDAGWVFVDPATGEGTSRFPEIFLSNGDGFWSYMETSRRAVRFDRSLNPASPAWPRESTGADESTALLAGRIQDVRWLGIHYGLESMEQGDFRIQNPGRVEGVPYTWESKERDGKHVVRQIVAEGWTTEWVIDPQRGWNAESVVIRSPEGERLAETHCVLEKLGDRWFPTFVTCYQSGILVDIVEVESGAFDADGGPAEFTPGEILEAGVQIVTRPSGERLVWDGNTTLNWPDWRDGVLAGAYQPGPNVLRAEAGIPSPYATPEQIAERAELTRRLRQDMTVRHWFGEWERFVAETIVTYKYVERQQELAREILKKCQERGHEYLAGAEERIHTAREELAEARRQADAPRVERAERKLEALREPIDEIFERMLKPRVLGLATDEQREAVEAAGKEPKAKQPAHEGP